MSASEALNPALARTKSLLFRPFGWATWSRIALLGLATGEFSGGSCNFHGGGGGGKTQQTPQSFANLSDWWNHIPVAVILAAVALVFVLVLITLYINSVSRFMLFESVLTGRASLREQWSRWQTQGRNYFAFQLLMTASLFGTLLVAIGVPLLLAWRAGMLRAPREHLAALILGGLLLFTICMVIALLAMVVQVIGKDFIVPQMALEHLDFVEAWRRYWGMLRQEKASYAGYLGMKALMRIGALIMFWIISAITIIILLLPFIIVFAISVGFGSLSGLTWTPFSIALAAVGGTIVTILLLFVIGFINAPVTVFFPSYALHFFSSRYRPLYDRMFPPLPPPAASPAIPA